MKEVRIMTRTSRLYKRLFDILFSFLGLAITWWLILAAFIVATIDTRKNGFFTQKRIGMHGKPFWVIKIRTMREIDSHTTCVTTARDPRITFCGRIFRSTKIDELPQLVNVLLGHMSFVGPRPDVPGFADSLAGDDRVILSIRPGITAPATLKYRSEEELLASTADPERYNREVIFPDKVRMNREYVQSYRFVDDLKCLSKTILRG